ncbi:serine--tRNA ligase [Candidatus Uhrbacteria bacterium]|nr:serine--tRNA ligase [Candidatus Uhrbacteria bacterium]
MIDIALIRKDPARIAEVAQQKGVAVDVDRLLHLDAERRELEGGIAECNRLRKEAAAEKNVARGKELKEQLSQKEKELKEIEPELQALLLSIPNLPSDDTPIGSDESANVVLRTVGEPRALSFKPKDHMELGISLGLIDTARAADISGTRFGYLFGDAVLLQFALMRFAFETLTNQRALADIIAKAGLSVLATPFTPVVPPVFIKPEVFQKMGRLEPKEERYYIPSDNQFLIGSAEHTLGPLHMDETIPVEKLPLRYVGYSTSFRREAGSYGKDTHGILRVHQFDKVEMESFTAPGDGLAEQDFFVAIQEHLVTSLGLPYRVILCSTGDQGTPDARHLDVEVWMPGEGKYRETHSADYMTDYQARRLGTRVKDGGGMTYAHMNDATVFAIGRMLIAILENGQQEDGRVRVPDALQKFVGKEVIG